ncbi:ABC transporter ATP-binding protein [Halorubrum sp. 48-1-W]|uniref:ABC transporter ATP-binding protein n=1 Tax=Halorubrum sp. 48-1-W TaxID=2249761 RepID=UPI000DCC2407|nr:ABC transporter ATP-binding protein [Halorubrum sp. 48-1-W]RAW44569.1 ABC transporter ATP-binding protein [Halorubrum sp. 48-1-W]
MLTVEDLQIEYDGPDGPVHAVNGISFSIENGVNYGISGESGCGKSTVADAILGLLPDSARITGGRIDFNGYNLLKLTDAQYRDLRWEKIAYIPQSAMDALDPVMTVGKQVIQTIRTNRNITVSSAQLWTEELFEIVGLDPHRTDDYPHEFSAGMRQRVVIAMALALEPDLIIADEPTTGLDAVVQDRIIEEILEIQERIDSSLLLITHDIATVAETCDEFSLLYGGKVMEQGSTENVLLNPTNPYTMGLKNAFLSGDDAASPIAIPGVPPELTEPPSACVFATRCPFSTDSCWDSHPELTEIPVRDQRSACHRVVEAGSLRRQANNPSTWGVGQEEVSDSTGEVLLEVEDLTKWYRGSQTLLDKLLGYGPEEVKAADEISLSVSQSEILGIAGESGSGKSTLAETMALFQEPTDGQLFFDGEPYEHYRNGRMMEFRQRVQIVFQNPFDALNPRMTVRQLVGEPITVHNLERGENPIVDTLKRVGIGPPEEYLNKYPHQLSGGERQRVAIARSLVLEPEVIICDEPASMLDVSLKASLLNLLRELAREREMGVVYISHDLSSLIQVADRLAIVHRGEVVERGRTSSVAETPRHPYTNALLSAMPETDPTAARPRVTLDADEEAPALDELPAGCSFAPRCLRADDHCQHTDPKLNSVETEATTDRPSDVAEDPNTHQVACHYPLAADGEDAKVTTADDDETTVKEPLNPD